MAHHVELPPILLRLTSNVVTAVGLPVLLGMASGLPTRKVVRGRWYNVRVPRRCVRRRAHSWCRASRSRRAGRLGGRSRSCGRRSTRRWATRRISQRSRCSLRTPSIAQGVCPVPCCGTPAVCLPAYRAYKGLVLYWSQLALNMAWSPLFFVAKQVGASSLCSAHPALTGTAHTDRLGAARDRRADGTRGEHDCRAARPDGRALDVAARAVLRVAGARVVSQRGHLRAQPEQARVEAGLAAFMTIVHACGMEGRSCTCLPGLARARLARRRSLGGRGGL
jgi:hypothetical protein